jgi:hypothetical protein
MSATNLGIVRCASMGWTTCDCCGRRVEVEDTFPGRQLGCGPYCHDCKGHAPGHHIGDAPAYPCKSQAADTHASRVALADLE